MSDKVSDLPEIVTLAPVDLLYIVDDPDGTPASKRVPLSKFFANVPANTVIKATFTVEQGSTFHGSNSYFTSNVTVHAKVSPSQLEVANNKIRIAGAFFTPASNSETVSRGEFWFDENYAYFAVADDSIKRVELQNFS